MIIVIVSQIWIFIPSNTKETNVIAASFWKETSDSDFNKGTFKNISIKSNGEVKLAQKTKYVEDNFVFFGKYSF